MRRHFVFALAVAALLVDSCGDYKRLTYLQDMETLVEYDVAERPDVKISEHDKLNILVTCQEPSLAAPFNLQSGTFSVDPNTGEAVSSVTSESSKGYLVDKNGYIDFPVLGHIKASGYTLDEFRNILVQKIIETKYLKDPIVLVEFMNFQFTVLGETGTGIYNVSNGHVNLLEALAMAGDLSERARRQDLWVIRTQDGHRTVYSVDMRSKSLYDSPVFYLQQNDLIYAKPDRGEYMRSRFRANVQLLFTSLSLLSTITLALSAAGVIKNPDK